MSAELADRIAAAIKAAMRAHDSTRLQTLRLLQAAIKQKAIDERITPSDDIILTIIEKQAKQRRESIAAFESAGRTDSAAQEKAELVILQEFLPQQATDAEVNGAISAAISAANRQGLQGGAAMGAIMGQLKKVLSNRADMAIVSARVRKQLSS